MELPANGRDLLDSVRAAALDVAHLERVIDRMRSAEGVRGAGTGVARGGGVPTSGMGATDARMDYESRVSERLDDGYALVDLGCQVCYGEDQVGSGGLCRVLGGKVADAVWWRCCAGATWPTTAEMVGMSERWCQQAWQQAADCIDALGIERIVAGEGAAED